MVLMRMRLEEMAILEGELLEAVRTR